MTTAYELVGGIANYFYFHDSAGNTIDPRQYIMGTEHFKKMSQELRIATPQENRARALIGAFYQRQTNHIYQNYLVDNLAPDLSVNGWPGTIWLTLQDRIDQDWAMFGEGEFDVTPQDDADRRRAAVTGSTTACSASPGSARTRLFEGDRRRLAAERRWRKLRRSPLPDRQRLQLRDRRSGFAELASGGVSGHAVHQRRRLSRTAGAVPKREQGRRLHPSPERALEAADRI